MIGSTLKFFHLPRVYVVADWGSRKSGVGTGTNNLYFELRFAIPGHTAQYGQYIPIY